MKIRNINKVLYTNGGTSDIIRVVMMAYDIESDPQIYELAERLKGSTTVETCKNIWQYLVDNIRYAADSDGDRGEMVRTPARLVHDGTGDCKSYSLFTAVILRYLRIKHVFRFASYSERREATHVYVVAFDTERETRNAKHEIVIDAVAKQQLNSPFGFEKKYNYKCDMANGGTKISYLAGFNPGQKAKKRIGALGTNIPISGAAITTIDKSLERLQAAYNINKTDYNREQLNVSKLLVHAATTHNLDAYKVSRSLYGIAYLSANGSLSSDYDTVRSEFDNVDYNNVSESNIDNELLAKLQNIVLEQKKNSVNGVGFLGIDLRSVDQKRARFDKILTANSAMYFFIRMYTEDEIVNKFSNSTELLKKRKYVGIFVQCVYNELKWMESELLNKCRILIEKQFGSIASLKAKIESGKLNQPGLPQVVRDSTAILENVINIAFYPIGEGIIDFNSQMVANVVTLSDEDEDYSGNSGNGGGGEDYSGNSGNGGGGEETPKSNTGLILGALSALFLLR